MLAIQILVLDRHKNGLSSFTPLDQSGSHDIFWKIAGSVHKPFSFKFYIYLIYLFIQVQK